MLDKYPLFSIDPAKCEDCISGQLGHCVLTPLKACINHSYYKPTTGKSTKSMTGALIGMYGKLDVDPAKPDGEEKDCGDCKYLTRVKTEHPCTNCFHTERKLYWQPKQPTEPQCAGCEYMNHIHCDWVACGYHKAECYRHYDNGIGTSPNCPLRQKEKEC